jgi:hypothetical protein
MGHQWNRVGNEYLFEMSVRTKEGVQFTLLSSWHNIVAIVRQKDKTMFRTQKHYSYNVTASLDKLVKQQKLSSMGMSPMNLYKLLLTHFGEESVQITPDQDVKFYEEEDDENYDEDTD